MQVQVTPVVDPPTSSEGATSPVIGAGRWFEPAPFVVRIERPMTFEAMVAALYESVGVIRDDMATPEDVWGWVALEVSTRGMTAIDAAAQDIEQSERSGTVDDPDWLEFCRDRVTTLTAGRELAATR